MSKNVEKKKIIIANKGEKITSKRTQNKSPFKKDLAMANLNKNNDLNITFPNKQLNFAENSNITEEKSKIPALNNKSYYLSKLNNSINNYGLSDNVYMLPLNNKGLKDLNIIGYNPINKNKSMKGVSLQNIKPDKSTNVKNNILNKNVNPSSLISTNNTNSGIINDKLELPADPYDSKYSIKINKIKDDYIDFLQKEFEDNTKKSVELDTNNKELLKKCDDLLHDNRVLSNTLNDRTTKLNNIIQENLQIKSQLDKCILNEQKNEQKLEFYEEQFNLFKSSNDNYQKIIKELKEQNEQLNQTLEEMEKTNEENLKNVEENYRIQLKEELENAKKEMEELYENKNLEENERTQKKNQDFQEKIKELKEKNEQLITDITNKGNMFDLISKENEKLTNENNLLHTQVEQYSHQINELNTIIKHKDSIINNLKSENLNLNTDKFLNKSSSYSMIKLDGSEYINENISKLITDNEENKMKIELLNDKIKSIDEMEKKYTEMMNGSTTISLSQKLAYQIKNSASPKNISTHFNYNSLNEIKNTFLKDSDNQLNNINRNNFRSFISPQKLELLSEFNVPNSPDLNKNKYYIKNKNNGNNVVVYSINDKKNKNIDKEIKVTKKNIIPEKENKYINRTKIVEIKSTPIKVRYQKAEDIIDKIMKENEKIMGHGKELEIEKDEVKESIREMNRKKNYTYKPKNNLNYSLEAKKMAQKNVAQDQLITIGHNPINLGNIPTYIDKIEEEKTIEQNPLYLYGIDRNDMLHTFDINNKQWCDIRKISDLEDKSDTFKKDYQYEGTLLFNNLYGVYILTGQKTDTLYYFNSQTNSISKICKFNNCHDNGSMMFDNNCLYVFGGKKITSCEYYSFTDKKIYKLPDLITDRANASYIVSNNKIFAFFGFSYSQNNYAKSIEYIDYIKKDKWLELKNIQFLKPNISFDTESVSTMYYRQNPNQILIYCGIQGEEEDFVTEYYLLYDSINNSMDKINKWNMQQYKNIGKKWKTYNFKKNDPKGFHFAKNTRFILLPKGNDYEGYNERDPIDIMIDYKNNIHYILQEKQKIDVYRSDM